MESVLYLVFYRSLKNVAIRLSNVNMFGQEIKQLVSGSLRSSGQIFCGIDFENILSG